jgi:hypothetical protein
MGKNQSEERRGRMTLGLLTKYENLWKNVFKF